MFVEVTYVAWMLTDILANTQAGVGGFLQACLVLGDACLRITLPFLKRMNCCYRIKFNELTVVAPTSSSALSLKER